MPKRPLHQHSYALTGAVAVVASDRFSDFHATQITVRPAAASWERSRYFALRQQVFSHEQQLDIQEQDGEDFRATAIVAITHLCGINDDIVGAVRIFPVADARWPQLWFGGRLCVAAAYRGRSDIGKALINTAVSRAKMLGARHFHAFVQQQNVAYFRSLKWQAMHEQIIAGQPHLRMSADLNCYPLRGLAPPNIFLESDSRTRRHFTAMEDETCSR